MKIFEQGLEHIDALSSMRWSGYLTSAAGGFAFLAQATTSIPTEVGGWASAGGLGIAVFLIGLIFGKLLPDMSKQQDAKDKLFTETLEKIQNSHSQNVDKVLNHCRDEMEKVQKRADNATELKAMLGQIQQRQAPKE